MLSLVLYGRNDNYGYNLHKRAALSLNCMAEILTHPDDEILFVDYNTPDDYPTFPEAIADTLTKKAKACLRIFRVRPEIHKQRFAARTHLKALEPVARNVAIRRSNERNRWILSTNTDMIFVPRTNRSLSDVAEGLEDGIYCAPRIELPETLWEGFDRLDPANVIKDTARWGRDFHLDEIVCGGDVIRYDAPGDFQLMTRQDLFRYHAFNEDMLRGWHLDSNISKRLTLVHGGVGDAAPFVFGYHCDHTRQITPMHAHRSPENSIRQYVDEVTEPGLAAQADSWGLADVNVEECSLERSSGAAYLAALKTEITRPLETPLVSTYKSEDYGRSSASPQHILPFLVDMFLNFDRSDNVLWIGQRGELYDMFAASWKQLGFSGALRVVDDPADLERTAETAAAYILNFGVPLLLSLEEVQESGLQDAFLALIMFEQRRARSGFSPRRFVCINTIHNPYERPVQSFIGAGRTPFSTRMRHGFLLADIADPGSEASVKDWTRDMWVGPEGRMTNGVITTVEARPGCIAYGPYFCLLPGTYDVELVLDVQSFDPSVGSHALVEVVISFMVRDTKTVTFTRSGRVAIRVPLVVTARDYVNLIEIRINQLHPGSFGISSVQIGPEGFDSQSAASEGDLAPTVAPPAPQGFFARFLSVFQTKTNSPDERRLDA